MFWVCAEGKLKRLGLAADAASGASFSVEGLPKRLGAADVLCCPPKRLVVGFEAGVVLGKNEVVVGCAALGLCG